MRIRSKEKRGVISSKKFDQIPAEAEREMTQVFDSPGKILIKVHFGEPGNKAALVPADVAFIIDWLKARGLEPIFIDSPVAYNSPRNSVKGYEQVAKDRGYAKLAPIIISNDYVDVKAKNFTVQVIKELAKAENVLVISHVKGHYCSGFGGAIKNLAMGGVTKKTKGEEHTFGKPKWVGECDGCGLCVKQCPSKAIKMVEGKAKILLDDCWGCSICEVNCPSLAPQVALFDDLLGQAAAAVISKLPLKTYYINILKNISKLCDCESDCGEIIAPDAGVLFSMDPVAIDRASLEKIGKQIFMDANYKDPASQIDSAEKYICK